MDLKDFSSCTYNLKLRYLALLRYAIMEVEKQNEISSRPSTCGYINHPKAYGCAPRSDSVVSPAELRAGLGVPELY